MTEYTPPLPDAVDFIFKGTLYAAPVPDAADFIFGAEDGGGSDLLLQTNFLIFTTM